MSFTFPSKTNYVKKSTLVLDDEHFKYKSFYLNQLNLNANKQIIEDIWKSEIFVLI